MARNKKIYESDLALLRNTFFDNVPAVAVYDPNDLVTVNFDADFAYITSLEELKRVSEIAEKLVLVFIGPSKHLKEIDVSGFAGVISPEQLKTNLTECVLHYYKSKFNTIRFGYPKQLKSPLFYNILHDNYEYLWYSQLLDRALFATGLGSLSSQGHYYVYHHNETHVDFGQDLKGNDFFFFSENYLFDRMSQCFLVQNGKVDQTIKYGDSELANERMAHELGILKDLNRTTSFTKSSIPKVMEHLNNLVLSNNWPSGASVPDLLTGHHYEALGEIYAKYKAVDQVGEYIKRLNFIPRIETFHNVLSANLQPNGLSKKHIEELCIEMLVLIKSLNKDEPFFTSIYHGNFSPSNIPVKGNVVYLNNWENAEPGMPMLFDIFYFMFSRMEASEHPKMGEFDDLMKRVLRSKELSEMIQSFDINFRMNLALFHLFHIMNRLESFLKQRFIHPNANFILTFWLQTMERINQLKI